MERGEICDCVDALEADVVVDARLDDEGVLVRRDREAGPSMRKEQGRKVGGEEGARVGDRDEEDGGRGVYGTSGVVGVDACEGVRRTAGAVGLGGGGDEREEEEQEEGAKKGFWVGVY